MANTHSPADNAPDSEHGCQTAGRQLEVVRGSIKKMRNDFGDKIDDPYATLLAEKIVRNLEVLQHGVSRPSKLEAILARISAIKVPTPPEALNMGFRVNVNLPEYGPYRFTCAEWWTSAPRVVILEYTKDGLRESPIPIKMDLEQKRFLKHPLFEKMDADAAEMQADATRIAHGVTDAIVAIGESILSLTAR